MDNSFIEGAKPENQIQMSKVKIKASNYVEPPFKVEYTLKIPDALKNIINRSYINFISEIMEDLESVKQ